MARAGGRPRGVTVIVLAAGHGRRLGRAGGLGPKWLIEVDGAPIADRHLEAVEDVLGPAAKVLAVVGHAAERVEAYCRHRERRDHVRPALVHNPEHATRNNWYSLLVGLDALPTAAAGTDDDDVIVVVNSDLFAPPDWIAAFLRAAIELPDVPGALAVDMRRTLTDEAMKVAAGPADVDGRRWCTAIGKTEVTSPIGEYVGMTALAPTGRARVHTMLQRFAADPARADAWYEGAFQELSAAEPFLSLWPTPTSAWVEIDDADDLLAAERLAGA